MDRTYWHKQTPTEPLFPDLQWSRPQTKATAGKLLIVGGNIQSFAAAGTAYSEAVSAGIGSTRVILPDRLQKTVSQLFPAAEYAPSTPSGSFGRQALAELLDHAAWADGVLLAGDLGRNSETAVLLEQFIEKFQGQLTITQDAADYFIQAPQKLLVRQKTLFVISFAQLQKLATGAHFATALTSDMDFLRLIDALHEFTEQHQISIVTEHLNSLFVAVNGQVSTTKPAAKSSVWEIKTAAQAAVWWLQNPSKPYEALSTAIIPGAHH
jgi:hypothetical protein